MPSKDNKALLAVLLLVLLSVSMSGCAELYSVLQTYAPTPAPGISTEPVKIGESVPQSSVKGVAITGSGNTITISGRGPYNLESPQDYFTLNGGNADVSIKLKGQGFGCTVMLGYKNPLTGVFEYVMLHEFTLDSRAYELSKKVSLPFTTRYCLAVNWGGDWEVRITQ
jgi:hypothetical protein